MTAASGDMLRSTGAVLLLPAGSVFVDATGRTIEVDTVTYRDVRYPVQLLRETLDGKGVPQDNVAFPITILFIPSGNSIDWRLSDSLTDILIRLKDWSAATFGPGMRTISTVAHIRKELQEVLDAPEDTIEWIDVAILGFDGAWRTRPNTDAAAIAALFLAKAARNEARAWPDYRTLAPGQPSEHTSRPT